MSGIINATNLEVANIKDSTGTNTAMTVDSSGNVSFGQTYPKIAVIQEENSSHTASGGTSANGDWQDRVLDTVHFDPDNIVTLSSNQFTLGAGTYIIEFSAPAFLAFRHTSALYDVTNSAYVEYGLVNYSDTGSQNRSEGIARVSITSNTTYKIRHHTATSRATNGLGVSSNVSGIPAIWTTVKITQIG